MITGQIEKREAIIPLEAFGLAELPRQLNAVIDTGFNGYLTLPNEEVAKLQLPFAGHRRATLADGNVIVLDVYLATVVWHDRRKEVLISQTVGSPLVGMALLMGSRLKMNVIDGGELTIEELPDVK